MPVPDSRRRPDPALTLDAPASETYDLPSWPPPSAITALTQVATLRYLAHAWLDTLLPTILSKRPNGHNLRTDCQQTAVSHWFQYLHACGVVFRPRKTIRGALQEYVDSLSRAGLTRDEVLWLDRGPVAWAVLGQAPAVRPDRPCLAASWSFPVAEESWPVSEEEGLIIQITRCLYRPACRLAAQSGEQPAACARTIEFSEAVRRVAGIATEARLVYREGGVCQLDLRAKSISL